MIDLIVLFLSVVGMAASYIYWERLSFRTCYRCSESLPKEDVTITGEGYLCPKCLAMYRQRGGV